MRKLRPEAGEPGPIVDLEGREIGRHRGIAGFTIGQRRGIEIGGTPEPLYVVRIEAEAGRLVVGPKAALAVRAARLEEMNWLGAPEGDLIVKVRSLAKPVPARIDGDLLRFEAPEYGVAPGQAAVLYAGDRVLGGGWIAETVTANLVAA